MFHSAHSALAWAYQVSATPIVKLSSINAMCGTPRRAGDNPLLSRLSVHEQHAQAAAIIGIAKRLEDPACREYIAARFAGRTKPEDVSVMMNRIFQALGTGIHGRRGAYKLLLCYFGKSISHKSIRYDLACGNEMVVTIRRVVYKALDGRHRKALALNGGRVRVTRPDRQRALLRIASFYIFLAIHRLRIVRLCFDRCHCFSMRNNSL